MDKYKIVALIGAAGSGKDTIMQQVLKEQPNWNEIISYTTRPPREGEVEGVNYHFCSDAQFLQYVANGEMLESTNFNNWFYGTPLMALDINTINIGVFNPAGIKAIRQNPKIDLTVFYVQTSDKERLIRQLNREEFPNINEVLRRYYTDQKDFSELDFSYYIINNEKAEDLQSAAEAIQKTVLGQK